MRAFTVAAQHLQVSSAFLRMCISSRWLERHRMGNCRGLVLPVPAKALPVWAKAFVFKAGGDLTLCDQVCCSASAKE